MKIGLINLVVDTNYGGNLQRFALCYILKQLGHNPFFIRIDRTAQYLPRKRAVFVYFKRFMLKIFGKYKDAVRKEVLIEREYSLQMKHVNEFIRRNVPCYTESFCELDDLRCLDDADFDAYIVGSDQVWRSSPEKHIERFFFDFLSDGCRARKIAYAASFGNGGNGYTQRQVEICGKLYSKFTRVSVRESAGVNIIKRFCWNCGSAPQVVLDPTFLVPRIVYSKLSKKVPVESIEGSIFCYILDVNKDVKAFVGKVASQLGKKIVWLDSLFPNIERQSFKKVIETPSIEQWLYNIETADYIITDSFHGTVFSIIFNKPFLTIKNAQRGVERYSFFLKKLELADRLIDVNAENIPIKDDVNWSLVNESLHQEVQKSISFLKDSLVSP